MKNEYGQVSDQKLIIVTRQDLSYGYQTVQSAHAVAEFCDSYPKEYKEWKTNSNSIICLAVKDEKKLIKLTEKLQSKQINISPFYEPDIDNQLTAIAIEPSINARKITSYIPLVGKKSGNVDKHYQQLNKIHQKMSSVNQFENQTVLEHGQSVHNWFEKIYKSIIENDYLNDLKIPEWVKTNSEFIINNLYDLEVIKQYCIYHDIGKPDCFQLDEDGKKHFPNHAEVSYNTYLNEFPNPNKIVVELILHDMDIHLLKDAGIENFLKLPIKQVITHLIVGLAELHANAQMFGGIESTSFKIKLKNIKKRGNKIFKILNNG